MLLDFTKMELYRILKMKSTYILSGIMIVLCLIYGFFLLDCTIPTLFGFSADDYDSYTSLDVEGNYDNDVYEDEYDLFGGSENSPENIEKETTTFSLIGPGLYYNADVAEVYHLNTRSLNALMLLGIFAGLFFGEPYVSGISKNFNRANKSRWVTFTAKLIASMIYTFVFLLITLLMSVLICAMWARKLVLGFDSAFVAYFLISYLISVAFVVTVAFVSVLFRNKAGAVTFAVFMALGTLDIIINIGDIIIEILAKRELEFSLADLLLTTNLSRLTLNSDGRDVIVAIVCGIIYFASAYIGSLLLTHKRDIR